VRTDGFSIHGDFWQRAARTGEEEKSKPEIRGDARGENSDHRRDPQRGCCHGCPEEISFPAHPARDPRSAPVRTRKLGTGHALLDRGIDGISGAIDLGEETTVHRERIPPQSRTGSVCSLTFRGLTWLASEGHKLGGDLLDHSCSAFSRPKPAPAGDPVFEVDPICSHAMPSSVGTRG